MNKDNKNMSGKKRLCVICGARVRNMNPKANTCSSDCTAIKHGRPSVAIQSKLCGNCQSPITEDDTSCGSCGATDFED